MNAIEKEEVIVKKKLTGFIDFIREQGVVGFAIGFILGGSISTLTKSLVDDIINPLVGLVLGKAKDFSQYSIHIGEATIKWGSFLNNLLNFIILTAVVYVAFKMLGLDRLDKKKESK